MEELQINTTRESTLVGELQGLRTDRQAIIDGQGQDSRVNTDKNGNNAQTAENNQNSAVDAQLKDIQEQIDAAEKELADVRKRIKELEDELKQERGKDSNQQNPGGPPPA